MLEWRNFYALSFSQSTDSLLPSILAQLRLSVKLTDFIKYSQCLSFFAI